MNSCKNIGHQTEITLISDRPFSRIERITKRKRKGGGTGKTSIRKTFKSKLPAYRYWIDHEKNILNELNLYSVPYVPLLTGFEQEEYLEIEDAGDSLSSILPRIRTRPDFHTIVLELFIAICTALKSLHDHGIIHNDANDGNFCFKCDADEKPIPSSIKVIDYMTARSLRVPIRKPVPIDISNQQHSGYFSPEFKDAIRRDRSMLEADRISGKWSSVQSIWEAREWNNLAINSVGQDSDLYSVGYLFEKILKSAAEVGRRGNKTLRLLEICSCMQHKKFNDFGNVIKAINDATFTPAPLWKYSQVDETPLVGVDVKELSEQNGFQAQNSTVRSNGEKKDFQTGTKTTSDRKSTRNYSRFKLCLMSFLILMSPFLYAAPLFNGPQTSLAGKNVYSKNINNAVIVNKIVQKKYSSQSVDASKKLSNSNTFLLASSALKETAQHSVNEKKETKISAQSSAESKLKMLALKSKRDAFPDEINESGEKAELIKKKRNVNDKMLADEANINKPVGGSTSIAGAHAGKKAHSRKRVSVSGTRKKQRHIMRHPDYMGYSSYSVRPPSQSNSESFDSGGQALTGWPSP